VKTGMTIARLHKELGKLIEDGHRMKKVNINKNTFTHTLEGDGCVILPVDNIEIQRVPIIDDNGGFKENKDGSESSMTCLVLIGENGE